MTVKILGPTLVLACLVACASTPKEPPLLANIVVSPLEEGRLQGGTAHYTVDASPAIVREVILDFESQEEFRPMVKEARLVSVNEDGGEVYFRFRGMVGIQPEANCVYVVEEDGDRWRLTYQMTSPSFALWALNGTFDIVPQKNGTKSFVRQQFLVSAIIMNQGQMLDELRVDAASIRDRAEKVAAGKVAAD
jgi:hypothetical protein